MNKFFVFSDEPCCLRCSRRRFDTDRMTDYCNLDGHEVKGWYAACKHFNEIRGRFGGWTAEVAEEPQPFKG